MGHGSGLRACVGFACHVPHHVDRTACMIDAKQTGEEASIVLYAGLVYHPMINS